MNLGIGLGADGAIALEAVARTIRESGAIYHALYGNDNRTMEDIDGGLPLIGVASTHLDQETDGHAALRIADAYAKPLTVPVTDSANITMIIVHRAAQNDRYFAAECHSSAGGNKGWRIYNNVDNGSVSSNIVGSWETGSHGLNARKQPVQGWRFSALSYRADGHMTCLVSDHGINNGNWTYDADGSRGAVLTGTKIKLGGHISAFDASCEIAEVIVFDSYKTLEELEAILERSYTRCRVRGVRIRVPGEVAEAAYEDDFKENNVLALVSTTPEQIISYSIVNDPQDTSFAGFRSLRMTVLRDSTGFKDVYAQFRWEINPGDQYRMTLNLTGESSSLWEFAGGTDTDSSAYFNTSVSSATRGEYSRIFTAGAGDNTFQLRIQVGVSKGNYRDIGGIRLENLSGGSVPAILEPNQSVPPVLSAGGTYYIDPENGSNLNDGSSTTDEGGGVGPLKSFPISSLYPNTTIKFRRGAEYPSEIVVRGSGADRDNMITLDFDPDDFDPDQLGPGNPCILRRGATLPGAVLNSEEAYGDVYDTFYPEDIPEAQELFFICGGEWIVAAQYPHPTNRIKQESSGDYLKLAGENDAYTTTSIVSEELPALHAIQALDGGNVFVRVWTNGPNSSNRFHTRTIHSYTDNGNGTATITWINPLNEPDVAAFAIGNHEAGMNHVDGGVFRQSDDGSLILFRDVGGTVPTAKTLEYAKGGRGIEIDGNYVRISNADVRLYTGSGITCKGTPTIQKTGVIIDNCSVQYGRGGGIGFEFVENFLIQDTIIDLIRSADNSPDTGGFRFHQCAKGVIARCTTNRIGGNQTHNGGSSRLYYVGTQIGEALTGHTNGFRFYAGNKDCHLLFCKSVRASHGMAVQNTRGNIRCVGSELNTITAVSFWPTTTNSPYPQQNSLVEHGGHWLLNSVFDGGQVQVNEADHVWGGTFANNIAQTGITSSVWRQEDQETGAPCYSTTSITLDDGGSGHAVHDVVSFSGAFKIRVDGVDGGGVITAWTIWQSGQNASPLSMSSQTSTNGKGTGAVVSSLTTKSARPLIQSHNVFVDDFRDKNWSPDAEDALRDENLRGWALTPTPATMANLFIDAINANRALRDYRPAASPPIDLSQGKPVTYDINPDDYERFGVTWPAGGITFDWIGRYNPATGQDAWDWQNADFTVL